jgi:hypothetical protein
MTVDLEKNVKYRTTDKKRCVKVVAWWFLSGLTLLVPIENVQFLFMHVRVHKSRGSNITVVLITLWLWANLTCRCGGSGVVYDVALL